jgi:hypothetical protein
MATTPNKEDEQWLSALAGKSDPAADPAINQQAAALRRALQAQRSRLDKLVPDADDAQYQQLLFRLRREGLLTANRGPRKLQLWAIAATVVLGIGVVVQMGGLQYGQDESTTLRGGGNGTVLVVPNPEARLTEILAGLKAAGAEPEVKREPGGRIVLKIAGSEKVLEYLATQRVEPAIANGTITLTLTPANPLK